MATGCDNRVATAQVQGRVSNGMDDPTPVAGSEKQNQSNDEAPNDRSSSRDESTRESDKEQQQLMVNEAGFQLVGESVDSEENRDTTCVENITLQEMKPTHVSDRETTLAREHLVSRLTTAVERSGRKTNGQLEWNGHEEHKNNAFSSIASAVQGISPAPFSIPPAGVTAGVGVSAVQDREASAEQSTAFAASSPGPASLTTAPDTAISLKPHEATETDLSNPMSQSMDLEKLLRWFPTTDPIFVKMLATRIEEALVIEDALICARIGKCQESSCRSVLLHYEHCKRDKICGDPKCTEMSIVYRHRRDCSKKDTAPTRDNKKFVCPFCIRIRQRRSLGVVVALDRLISDQHRVLQEAHSEANRNACLQSINAWTKRKQILRAEIDRLNHLASESNALIFNFPRYQWHFGDAALIKREPTLLGSESNTAELSAPGPSMNSTNRSTVTAQTSSIRSGDEHNSVSGTALLDAFVDQLLVMHGLTRFGLCRHFAIRGHPRGHHDRRGTL